MQTARILIVDDSGLDARLERLLLQFDLEATRREREELARQLRAHGEDGSDAAPEV